MLHIDIDSAEIESIAREMGATQDQVRKAWNRAIQRSAGTLRKMTSKMRSDIGIRKAATVRRRMRVRRGRGKDNFSALRLWFGLNDLPIHELTGRARQTARGVTFRDEEFEGAFMARVGGGRRRVWKRSGSARFPVRQPTASIVEQGRVVVEDQIFTQLPDIFMEQFVRDLRARVQHGVGE